MPSVVVRILVAEGDQVEKGQGVVVVMAMKMETTLRAPFSGKMLKINVSVGDKVMPGQILVDIEREAEADSQHQGSGSD
jgi:biotin carboxyl carrier protein